MEYWSIGVVGYRVQGLPALQRRINLGGFKVDEK